MDIRERTMQGNYLLISGKYELLNVGFTELDEQTGVKTKDKRYVGDKSTTTFISNYSWESSFTADQIRNNKAIDYITNIGRMCLTGSKAETSYIIVDLDTEGTAPNTFRARKFKTAISVKDFKNSDGDMQVSGSFLGQGDPVLGTFNTLTCEFTNAFTPATLGTLTLTSVAGTTTGTTKITVTPALTSGNSYVYITGASIVSPVLNEIVSEYASFDGVSDITATTGNKILIVEVDEDNRARKSGIATVVSKA